MLLPGSFHKFSSVIWQLKNYMSFPWTSNCWVQYCCSALSHSYRRGEDNDISKLQKASWNKSHKIPTVLSSYSVRSHGSPPIAASEHLSLRVRVQTLLPLCSCTLWCIWQTWTITTLVFHSNPHIISCHTC